MGWRVLPGAHRTERGPPHSELLQLLTPEFCFFRRGSFRAREDAQPPAQTELRPTKFLRLNDRPQNGKRPSPFLTPATPDSCFSGEAPSEPGRTRHPLARTKRRPTRILRLN